MLNTATKNSSVVTSAGELITTQLTTQYDTDLNQNFEVPPGASNKSYVVSIPTDGLRMFALSLSQESGDQGETKPVTVTCNTAPATGVDTTQSGNSASFNLVTVNGALLSGSGATVTITAVNGQITAVTATPPAGGTGYPASATFTLGVSGGGGSGGSVSATTNSSGVIITYSTTPVAAGSNYATTTGAATSTAPSVSYGGTNYLSGGSGSINLNFTDPSGHGFGGAGTATVVNGVITSAAVTSAGQSYGASTSVGVTIPDQFVMYLGIGVNWIIGDLFDCPITSPVTVFYVTNPSTANMTLQVRAGYVSASVQ